MKALKAAKLYGAAIKDRPFVRVIDAPAINAAHVAWGPADKREAVTFTDGVTRAELQQALA